jgi:hypothetical protein
MATMVAPIPLTTELQYMGCPQARMTSDANVHETNLFLETIFSIRFVLLFSYFSVIVSKINTKWFKNCKKTLKK